MKKIEAIAITGLVLLACGSTVSARPPAFEEIGQQLKGKQDQASADDLMRKPGLKPDVSRPDYTKPAFSKPNHIKPDLPKPDYTKPAFSKPTNLCGPRFGVQQILALLRGGDPVTCSSR